MNILYIRAATLHFRLTVFFDTPGTDSYDNNLRALWLATTSFLEQAFSLSTEAGPIIKFATNYILQMIIAAGFALLKLLNSSFVKHIDFDYGKKMFAKTIETIHVISVTSQDLPCRLAQVLVQLWKAGDVGKKGNTSAPHVPDHSLQLKVRCRMSMSLVYDSVWRWREEFKSEGYTRLEGENPHTLPNGYINIPQLPSTTRRSRILLLTQHRRQPAPLNHLKVSLLREQWTSHWLHRPSDPAVARPPYTQTRMSSGAIRSSIL